MKIKKLLSFILAFVIAVLPLQFAFAEEDNYNYLGEINLGNTTIWRDDINYGDGCLNFALYVFNAPADGYYLFRHGTPDAYMWAGIIESESDKFPPDCIETVSEDNETQEIYYLNKGKHIFNVEMCHFKVSINVYTEYLGESVTDISFEHDQLWGPDFNWHKTDDGYYFVSSADAAITFSSGKTVAFSNGMLTGKMLSEPVDGDNELIIDFLGQQIPSSATVYPESHYITDAELSNVEKYTENVVRYYNHYEMDNPYGETVTVTFSDGSTDSAVYTADENYITFPNGQEYEFTVSYNTYVETLLIRMGNYIIKEYDLYAKKASLSDNFEVFVQECKDIVDESAELFNYSIENLDFEYFTAAIRNLSNVLSEFSAFMTFCFDLGHVFESIAA